MTTDAIHRQIWLMMVNEREIIGRGIARTVYQFNDSPEYVCKVEDAAKSWQNVMEWETWLLVRDTVHARWFAPCRQISPDGTILVQQRTRPPAPHEFPDRMPAYMCDFKRTNFGVIGRRIVCHDYGLSHMLDAGLSKRMKRVKWWNLEDR